MSKGTKSLTLVNLFGHQVKETRRPGIQSMRMASLCVCVCVCVCVRVRVWCSLMHALWCDILVILHSWVIIWSLSPIPPVFGFPNPMPHFFSLDSLLHIFKLKSIHPYLTPTVEIFHFPFFFFFLKSCSSAWSCRDTNIQGWPLDQCCSIKR